jgi:Tol biopolymer transport system component
MTDVEQFLAVSNAHSPAFAADGDRLAYLSDETGTLQVWVTAGPEATPRRLTNVEGGVSFFSWSPTRNAVVFGADSEGDERVQLYRVSGDGGETTRLTDAPDAMHRWGGWSRDGDRFAFTANRRSGHASDVFVYSIDGKSRCVHQTDGWFDVAGWGARTATDSCWWRPTRTFGRTSTSSTSGPASAVN